MALRRWKSFLPAFELIDAAIEAADADGVLSRDEFRGARVRIAELLCDAGGEKAEALCGLLDDAMAGALATLRAVPVDKNLLALSGELVGALGALMTEHASGRVRELARHVVREWRAAAKAEVARAMAVLNALPSTPPPPPRQHDTELKKEAAKIPQEQPRPRKTAVVSSRRVNISTAEPYGPSSKTKAPIVSTSNAKSSANMEAHQALVPTQPKKTLPLVVSRVAVEEKKIEATKRRLHDRYQEAEDAKRRRMIQVIKPPHRPLPETTSQRPAQRARRP